MITTKTCPKCKIEKTISEFWKNKSREDGLYHICIDCGKIEKRKPKWDKPVEVPAQLDINVVERVISECNHVIATRDIVSEIIGLPLYTSRFHLLDQNKRKVLARKVTDYMKPKYKIYSENSRGITWLVK
jgi:Zn ribbon nucleic-acid-binding protein